MIQGLTKRRRNRGMHRGRRRAGVLIAALVCLGIVITIVGCMLVAAVQNGRQLHGERDRRQCELLLTYGLARAARPETAKHDYRGESWTVPAEQISGTAAGRISIEFLTDRTGQDRQLHVIAEYPLGGETSIRRSQTIIVPLTGPTRQE